MSDSDPSRSPNGAFPTTRWSLVGRAGQRPARASAANALGDLIRIYLPALRAHLVRAMRIEMHRADDLLQGFLADKVLEQNLIALADPGRGKFRTFLLTALERFIVDQHRYESAQKRSPRSRVENIDDRVDSIVTEQRPSDAFDRAWAGEVLSEVMRRLRDECRSSGRSYLWDIFELRMLRPITDGVEAPSHEELARRYRLESATQSANALGSAKRLFVRNFRFVVGEYAADESEVDSEIKDLWEIFSRPAA